ncbi:hypothetical protein D3C85_1576640 [compost metagenome]
MSFQVTPQARVFFEVDQPAFILEGVDHTVTAPLNVPADNVARHGERQFAVRLDIKRIERRDINLVRSGGHTDADFAPRLF